MIHHNQVIDRYLNRSAGTGPGSLAALTGVRVLDLSDGIAGVLLRQAVGMALGARGHQGRTARRATRSGGGRPRARSAPTATPRACCSGTWPVVSEASSPISTVSPGGTGSSTSRRPLTSWSRASPRAARQPRTGPGRLWEANQALTVVSITPFGQEGPRSGATHRSEFLLQAAMGSLEVHGGRASSPRGGWASGRVGGRRLRRRRSAGGPGPYRPDRPRRVGRRVDALSAWP